MIMISLLAFVLAASSSQEKGASFTFQVVDVDSSQGLIRAALFPEHGGDSIMEISCAAQSPTTILIWEGVPFGTYRCSIRHEQERRVKEIGREFEMSWDEKSPMIFSGETAGVSCRISLKHGWTDGSDITVHMRGFRNDKGWARVALFHSPRGFPNDTEFAWSTGSIRIRSGRSSLVFLGVPPGVYAIGVLHDENENGTMDTNRLGVPREGYGASNDARGKWGPPAFDQAAFEVRRDGLNLTISIKN